MFHTETIIPLSHVHDIQEITSVLTEKVVSQNFVRDIVQSNLDKLIITAQSIHFLHMDSNVKFKWMPIA